MKIIVVRVGDVKLYPPTISLINILVDLGQKCILISTKDSKGVESAINTGAAVKYIDYSYNENKSIFGKAMDLSKVKKMLWKEIEKHYDSDCLLWVESDISIKHLGKRLLAYKYVLQMDELNDGIYYSAKFKHLRMDASLLGNKAKAVVVPEYNRAHITKAWWNLNQLPYILPNKPYVAENNNFDVKISNQAEKVLNEIKGKKIVLYQGGLGKERPIQKFVEAVEELEEFAFVIMSGDYSEYSNKGYKNCYFIDYMIPPAHLKVTAKAFIGIVTYVATQGQNSVLNALYCAPNKIYEYARYGVPVIGNDIPGLRTVINEYKNGLIANSNDVDEIKDAIITIAGNYDFYSHQAKAMYDKCDNKNIVEQILKEIDA